MQVVIITLIAGVLVALAEVAVGNWTGVFVPRNKAVVVDVEAGKITASGVARDSSARARRISVIHPNSNNCRGCRLGNARKAVVAASVGCRCRFG